MERAHPETVTDIRQGTIVPEIKPPVVELAPAVPKVEPAPLPEMPTAQIQKIPASEPKIEPPKVALVPPAAKAGPALRRQAVTDLRQKIRLVETIRFFELAVNRPIEFDAGIVGAARAFLGPRAVVMMEDANGNYVPKPLLEFPAGKAISIMKAVAKRIPELGGPKPSA